MTKRFMNNGYTFNVTECIVRVFDDFDPDDGTPIVKRKHALLVEWENSRGIPFNAIAFSEMPKNNSEFDELWCDPFPWTTDHDTLCTVEVI